jgi:phenylpropionate dioxygenase-like ring-hydroxylating dioxygenase large terminal subunit
MAPDRISDMESPAPGEHRCPGPSAQDIIRRDGDTVPPALLAQSYRFEGDADISYDRYVSQDFFDLEMKHVWPKVWQWVCREEHVAEPGDYITYDIGPHSIIVLRDDSGAIRAFHNACLHRGTQLRPSDSSGSSPQLRCPYHGWTWDLAGQVKDIPCRWDFPHVKDENYRLPPVKCETWGGFVWINLDPQAMPLSQYLGVLPEHFQSGWDLKNRFVYLHIQKELHTNWKAALEAFLEAYHVLETHPQNLPASADANTQYDVFGDHVSRFLQNIGSPSPHLNGKTTEQDALDALRATKGLGLKVPPGGTARSVAAAYLRKSLGEAWGVDLSGYSTSELLDSINYNLFPNACLFPGVTHPMVYRFRPIGNEPGRTMFDLIFMRPLAPGQEVPPPPEPVKLTEAESYTTVPGILQSLAVIFDQDTSNLRMQYRGFQASAKRGQTLGNYQEIRIRHLHKMVDRYIAAGQQAARP